MARSTHTRPGEWGSKARKAEARSLRIADRKAAIAEGIADARKERTS